MPIERSQINAVVRSIKVDYFGNSLTITYKPDAITPAKEAELVRLRLLAQENRNGDGEDEQVQAAAAGEQLAARLESVIVAWDVVENGEPLPPTKENLMTFPNAFLSHITVAIGDDLVPKPKTTRR